MATETKVKWAMEADYLQACNCDYGCPCEFEAPPTRGNCEAIGAWRINKGNYGDVSLDGIGIGFSLKTKAALHEGDITLAAFIDEKANDDQKNAILQIMTGAAGGLPFEIIASLVSNMLEPQIVPFNFNIDGQNSSVSMGSTVMAFEPIKNPVTGDPEKMRIEHETGFLFKGADVVSAKECKSSVAGLEFSWPNLAGFVTQVTYGN
jgi:hypothetical protein